MEPVSTSNTDAQVERAVEDDKLNCEDTRDLLYLFLNNELEDDESRLVCAHLLECGECRQAMAEHVKLSGVLKRTLPGVELRYYSENN